MHNISIIALKEVKEILKTKSNLIMGIIFGGFFSFTYSGNVVNSGPETVNSAVFFLSLSIGLFMAYISIGQLFLIEKRAGVIETLMCAPVSLRQIWAGKTIAGLVPAWIMSLIATISMVIISGVRTDSFIIPKPELFVHVLIVVPLFIYGFIGLVGFGQLSLGMKENKMLNMIIFFPAFAALYGSSFAVSANITVSWLYIGIVFAFSLLLTGIGSFLTQYLSRERIVTTID